MHPLDSRKKLVVSLRKTLWNEVDRCGVTEDVGLCNMTFGALPFLSSPSHLSILLALQYNSPG
ncbi:MAG: hypothetical protein ACTSVT_02485, partial [Candidatus Thorarchaeota archaeon]